MMSQTYCLDMLRKQIKDCALEYVAAETMLFYDSSSLRCGHVYNLCNWSNLG